MSILSVENKVVRNLLKAYKPLLEADEAALSTILSGVSPEAVRPFEVCRNAMFFGSNGTDRLRYGETHEIERFASGYDIEPVVSKISQYLLGSNRFHKHLEACVQSEKMIREAEELAKLGSSARSSKNELFAIDCGGNAHNTVMRAIARPGGIAKLLENY